MPLITSSLAEAVPPVPMKATLVGAIACGCGAKFSALVLRRLLAEGDVGEDFGDAVAPIRSPNSSAIETSPPPL